MSQQAYALNVDSLTLAAGQVISLWCRARANAGWLVTEFGASIAQAGAGQTPMLIELVSSTDATIGGTGTPITAQIRGRITGGEDPNTQQNNEVAPTSRSVIARHKAWYLAPGRRLVIPFPYGREPEVDDSGQTIRTYGVMVTSVNAAGDVALYMEVEKNG